MMEIVFDQDPAFPESEQGDKRRACHFPSCGEVSLLSAVTLEAPRSGTAKPLKSC